MKRKLFLALGLTLALLGFQEAKAQRPTIRLEAAGMFSGTTSVKSETTLQELKGELTYRLAGAVELKLLPFVYVAPGLAWQENAVKIPTVFGDAESKRQALSLPVNVGVRVKPFGILGLSLEAGPYLRYMLKNDSLKDNNRFTYGAGASVALELSRVYFRLGGELDLKEQKLAEGLRAKDYNVYLGLGLRI